MKSAILSMIILLFVSVTCDAQEPNRIISPPQSRPLMGNNRGVGKQDWQHSRPQQIVRPNTYIRPYVHPFYYPSIETRFHPRHGFYRVYRPPVITPQYSPNFYRYDYYYEYRYRVPQIQRGGLFFQFRF